MRPPHLHTPQSTRADRRIPPKRTRSESRRAPDVWPALISGEASRFEWPEARTARGVFQLGTRLLVYAVATTVILAGVLQAMRSFGLPIATREGGLVQSVQLILLVASSLILLLVSNRRSTVVFRFLAFLPIMAATRELDSVLETYLFDESHKLGLVIISVVALTYVMRHRREFLRQLESVLSCRSFGLLFAAVVLVVVVPVSSPSVTPPVAHVEGTLPYIKPNAS